MTIEIIKQYNSFQNDYGQSKLRDFKTDSLFTTNFSKTVNGKSIVESSSKLLKQLGEVKNSTGSWEIQPIEIQPFLNDKKRYLNCYQLNSEKAGSFYIMSIVTVNENNLIDQINEVYYQIS